MIRSDVAKHSFPDQGDRLLVRIHDEIGLDLAALPNEVIGGILARRSGR